MFKISYIQDKKNIFSKIPLNFAENIRTMEQEIQDISIKRIQEAIPQLKGIENDLIIDYTEYNMPNDKHPIHRYPLRLDGLYIGVREKGKATFNINLKEYEVGPNDLVICSPGDLMQATIMDGAHLAQSMMISSHFLKEMYISLNSFMPFFASQKDHPVFHLTTEEKEELKVYFSLIKDAAESNDYFRVDIIKRLLAAYLYKLGSILLPPSSRASRRGVETPEARRNPVQGIHQISKRAPSQGASRGFLCRATILESETLFHRHQKSEWKNGRTLD